MYRVACMLFLLPAKVLAVSFFAHIDTIPQDFVAGEPFALRVVVYSDEHFSFAEQTQTSLESNDRLEITYFQPQTFAPLPPIDPYRAVFVMGPYRAGSDGNTLGEAFDVTFFAPNDYDALPPDTAARARFQVADTPQPNITPDAGVWWIAADPGVGYALDVQGDFVFLVEYGQGEGSASWRTAQGMREGVYFQAEWIRTTRASDGTLTQTVDGQVELLFEDRSRAWIAVDESGYRPLERFLTTATEALGPDDQFPTARALPDLAGTWLVIDQSDSAPGAVRTLELGAASVDRSLTTPTVSYSATADSGLFCEPDFFAFVPEQTPDLPPTLPPFERYSCRLMLDGRLDFARVIALDQVGPGLIEFGSDSQGAVRRMLRIDAANPTAR